jgi:hypothetical protein
MPSPILTQCRQTADAVEAGAAQLGPSWSGYGPLNALCAHFRRSAEELAENRGLSEITDRLRWAEESGQKHIAWPFYPAGGKATPAQSRSFRGGVDGKADMDRAQNRRHSLTQPWNR